MKRKIEERTTKILIKEFKEAPGKFLEFYRAMNIKERKIFKKWIGEFRNGTLA